MQRVAHHVVGQVHGTPVTMLHVHVERGIHGHPVLPVQMRVQAQLVGMPAVGWDAPGFPVDEHIRPVTVVASPVEPYPLPFTGQLFLHARGP